MKRLLMTTYMVLLPAAPLASAQANQNQQQEDVKRETVVYEAKARPPGTLGELLRSFLSRARVTWNENFNTIIIEGTPDEHAVARSLLEKYDRAQHEINFQFYILKAVRDTRGLKDGLPDKIRRIVSEVSGLTRYSGFELLDTPNLRLAEGRSGSLASDGPFSYQLNLNFPDVLEADGNREIRINQLHLQLSLLLGYSQRHRFLPLEEVTPDQLVSEGVSPVYRSAEIETSFSIHDGETIVLGASRIQGSHESDDVAIVTIVEARIIH